MLSKTKLAVAVGVLVAATTAPAFAQPEHVEGGETKREIEHELPPPPDPSQNFNFLNIHYNGKDEFGGPIDGHEGPAGAEGSYEEEPMSAPFVLALVNFAIFLFLIAKYGGPVAKKVAAERHDQIKTALDEAAKLRKQAEDKLADYDKRIAGVDGEIAKLVDGIKADAEADKARILDTAEKQAVQMKRDAELRIAAEIGYARAALTREVSIASSKITEKLLREKLQPSDQEKLVATFISDMQPASRPGKESV